MRISLNKCELNPPRPKIRTSHSSQWRKRRKSLTSASPRFELKRRSRRRNQPKRLKSTESSSTKNSSWQSEKWKSNKKRSNSENSRKREKNSSGQRKRCSNSCSETRESEASRLIQTKRQESRRRFPWEWTASKKGTTSSQQCTKRVTSPE